jgi:hypothetical protein
MTSVESKSMDRPDETHTPTKLTASVVHLGTATVKRLQAEPGFRWSECIKPLERPAIDGQRSRRVVGRVGQR